MKKTTMLRNFLNQPGLRVAPGVYDCVSARVAESVGFRVLFMTGYGIRESQLGIPDFGIATATDIINIVRNMVHSVDIPIFVDADDGYGGALAAYRTTQELIRVGAAGMFIEDQKHPTKCPAIAIQEVLPREEYLGKLGAVMEARDKEDKDFVICARIDAAATLGVEEMLARVKACVELGVDMIFPQHIARLAEKYGKSVKDTKKELYKKIGAPKVWIWGMGPPYDLTAKDYEEIGAKLFVPGNPLPPVTKTLIDMYKGLYDTGTEKSFHPSDLPDDAYLNELGRLGFWEKLEKKYVM